MRLKWQNIIEKENKQNKNRYFKMKDLSVP